MRFYIIILLTWCCFCAIAQKAEPFSPNHLLYANENLDIKNLIVLDRKYSLLSILNPNSKTRDRNKEFVIGNGHISATKRHLDSHNLILLKDGIPVDTLEGIAYPTGMKRLDSNLYSFSGLGTYHEIKINRKQDKIERIRDLVPYRSSTDKGLYSLDKMWNAARFGPIYVDCYQGYAIGKKRFRGMAGFDKRDQPYFFVEKLDTKEKIFINPKEDMVSKFKRLQPGPVFYYYAGVHTYHHDKIYFNVISANKCYIFNTKTEQITSFTFPAVKRKQGCKYIYDFVADKQYVIRRVNKKTYELFSLSNDYQSIRKLAVFNFMPLQIVDNHILKEAFVEDGGKAFTAYYLVPLLFEEEKRSNMLEHIDIH